MSEKEFRARRIAYAICDWLQDEMERNETKMIDAASAKEDAGDRVMRMRVCARRIDALNSSRAIIGSMPLSVIIEAMERAKSGAPTP